MTPSIYTFTGVPGNVEDVITLTGDGRNVLITHRDLLDYIAVSGWVRFTESFTTAQDCTTRFPGSAYSDRASLNGTAAKIICQ